MSEVKVNKISPRSGTDVTLGDSGDTFTLPTGVTLDTSNSTVTLPDGSVTNAKISDSTIELAKLSATGTKDATTFLRGDNTFAEPSGGDFVLLSTTTITSGVASVDLNTVFSSNTSYKNFKVVGNNISPATESVNLRIRFYNASDSVITSSTYSQMGHDAYAEVGDANGTPYAHRDRDHFGVEGAFDATAQHTSSFMIDVYDPHTDAINKWFDITGRVDFNNNATFYGTFSQGVLDSAVTLNGIQIFFSSGNIDGGIIQVYGY